MPDASSDKTATPKLRLLGSRLGAPCKHEEGGWPEVKMTVTFYAEGTDDLDTVRRLAALKAEEITDFALDLTRD